MTLARRSVLAAAAWPLAAPAVALPQPAAGRTFERPWFGLHIHRAERIAWPAASFGTWRLWDAGISWADIQPAPDAWNTARLDALLALAERHGVQVLLPLALTPPWAAARPAERAAYRPGNASPPRDVDDWARFVRRLVRHTRGRVYAYEVWNEANVPAFFTGDVPTLVAMTRALRDAVADADSGALVVAPSGAGLLDRRRRFVADFLDAGGGAYVDALNFHLYTGPHGPETMIEPVSELAGWAARARLPLWNTESGYWVRPGPGQRGSRHADALPAEQAAAYLVRAHVLARALGVERFVAYAWDNAELPFAQDDGRTPNVLGRTYAAMVDRLAGARLLACDAARRGPCVARLAAADGRPFLLAWAAGPDRERRWRVPAGPLRVRALDGTLLADAAETVDLDPMPVVLE